MCIYIYIHTYIYNTYGGLELFSLYAVLTTLLFFPSFLPENFREAPPSIRASKSSCVNMFV